MKVIFKASEAKLRSTVAAIGIFDGLHRGHQLLLNRMLKKAHALKAQSMVITFFPHPAHVLKPEIKLGYLVSLEHRLKLLAGMGVDICLVMPFTKKFAHIEPQNFIRNFLVKRLNVKAVFVGEDFRFGRNRAGDINLFKLLAMECGYEMHAVEALKQGNEPISSTRLRRLIAEGNLKEAKQLLGRPFSVFGIVVKGEGRGKLLGFPTANVNYQNDIMPPQGVYAVRVLWKNKTLMGVANLGQRPTFKSRDLKVHLEVYIFDFQSHFYGDIIEVEFIAKIRDERKFPTLNALIEQINKDIKRAKTLLLSK